MGLGGSFLNKSNFLFYLINSYPTAINSISLNDKEAKSPVLVAKLLIKL